MYKWHQKVLDERLFSPYWQQIMMWESKFSWGKLLFELFVILDLTIAWQFP